MDTPRPLFTSEEIAAWPAGSFERLQQLNLLRPAENRAYITCPNCDERHESEVVLRREGDGRTRMFATCPEALRVELSAKDIHCWTIDFERFARYLSAALSLDGHCRALSAARAWHLGRTRWQDAVRDVAFVRGLGWPDQAVVIARLGPLRSPIVLVGGPVPGHEVWPGIRAAIVPLAGLASVGQGGLTLDHAGLSAAVRHADQEPQIEQVLTLDKLKLMVRQQVSADRAMRLDDDALVQAYQSCGSVREAARLLTEATGRNVSKDRVARAVKRRGGVAIVGRHENTRSVQRVAVSQRRDNREHCERIRGTRSG
jgi:hypothetical protein